MLGTEAVLSLSLLFCFGVWGLGFRVCSLIMPLAYEGQGLRRKAAWPAEVGLCCIK